MRRLLAILAVVTLLVACTDDKPSMPQQMGVTGSFTPTDSSDDDSQQEPPIWGVEIGGETLTEYTFAAGDKIRLVSERGVDVVLTAESAGSKGIRFNGDFRPVAEVDTYYAIYPATYELQSDGSFHVDNFFDVQTGDGGDAALLGAVAYNVSGDQLHLDFHPINSLLYVTVEDAPSQIDAAVITPHQSRTFINNGVYYINYNGDEGPMFYYDDEPNIVEELVIEKPSSDGFFISFPASTYIADGFTLTIRSGDMSVHKVFEGDFMFKCGYTYRTSVQWGDASLRGSVSCGARTSYDYYKDGAWEFANKMTDIAVLLGSEVTIDGVSYNTNATSTYTDIYDDEISDAGVILRKNGSGVDMKYSLPFGDGIIGKDCEFNLDFESIEWAEYLATAYVTLKDGRTLLSDARHIVVTGLPYDTQEGLYHGFYTVDEKTWGESAMDERYMKFFWYDISNGSLDLTDNTKWYGHGGVGLHAATFRWAQILSPKFCIPQTTDVKVSWELQNSYAEVQVGMFFSTPEGDDNPEDLFAVDIKAGETLELTSPKVGMTPDYPCIQIEHRTAQILPSSVVRYMRVEYARY